MFCIIRPFNYVTQSFFLLKLPLDSLHFHSRYLLILLLNQLSTLRATIYRILFSYYQQISGLQGLILRLF